MPDQLVQLFVADRLFVRCGAVENTDNLSIYFSNKKALRIRVDAPLDCLACRGLFRRKTGRFDDKAAI
jgi:hypothetical protein